MHFVETIKVNGYLTKVFLHDIETIKDGSGTLELYNHARTKIQTVDFSLKAEEVTIEKVFGSQPHTKEQYNELKPYLLDLFKRNPIRKIILV
jgi:hypothetical protein